MLNQYVSVYVPGTRHAAPLPAAEHEAAVRRVAGAFSEVLGGATALPGLGFWNSASAGLISEHVTIVKAYHEAADQERAVSLARSLALALKAEFAQEAVTI